MNPEPALEGTAMGDFKGTKSFELSTANDGIDRIYHGPEVVGSSRCWGSGAMTGRGTWPLLGHNFASWSILLHDGCQITGGRFSMADEVLVNVVGIAVPEMKVGKFRDGIWPSFEGASTSKCLIYTRYLLLQP